MFSCINVSLNPEGAETTPDGVEVIADPPLVTKKPIAVIPSMESRIAPGNFLIESTVIKMTPTITKIDAGDFKLPTATKVAS